MKKLLVVLAFLVATSAPFALRAQTCTQTLSSGSNVGSAVSSAAAGAILCLNNGTYGGFTLNNISKNPRVLIRAVNRLAATFTSEITLQGSTSGLTFDGFNFGDISVLGAVHDLTFRNYNQT